MKWRMIAAALVLLAFVLLACSDVGNGACESPAPCYSQNGHNP